MNLVQRQAVHIHQSQVHLMDQGGRLQGVPGSFALERSPTTMKIDADEKKLLESVERGEWKSAGGGKRERTRYARYAKATFRKDRRLNIRLSSKDLEAIQKRALAEGLPYQTLIASLLHKYASGRLREI
jgi:predicted DNA binding CopG/RHH family protein